MLYDKNKEWCIWKNIEYTKLINLVYEKYNYDIFGRLKKIIDLLTTNSIIIESIKLIDPLERKFKINMLLSEDDKDFTFKFGEINFSSCDLKYNLNIFKNKCGITSNIETIKDNNIIYTDKIINIKKDIKKYAKKIIRVNCSRDYIKNIIDNSILNSEYKISDNLYNYIIDFINEHDKKYYNIYVSISYTNNLKISFYERNKKKILKSMYIFNTYSRTPNYYIEYSVYIINEYWNILHTSEKDKALKEYDQ